MEVGDRKHRVPLVQKDQRPVKRLGGSTREKKRKWSPPFGLIEYGHKQVEYLPQSSNRVASRESFKASNHPAIKKNPAQQNYTNN